jgi:pimeloyl-ACP methyl ester carboxylesterase
MEPYQIILIVIASILLVIIITFLIIITKIYFDIFHNPKRADIKDDTNCKYEFNGIKNPDIEPMVKVMVQEAANKHHENLYVKAYDGKRLHGSLYRFGDENSPVVICFHGYKGNKFRDFCGAIKIFEELKINTILVDQRGQNESEGVQITFGVKESYDVITWINKAKEIYGESVKISLEGLSMGGATVLYATAYRNLPDNVKNIIVDCPFTSCYRIFEHSLKHTKLPNWIIDFTSLALGGLFMRVNFSKYDVLKGYKNTKIPTLIIHGTGDKVIPYTESLALKDKYPDIVQVELFEQADHGISYFRDIDRYKKVSIDHLRKYLFK